MGRKGVILLGFLLVNWVGLVAQAYFSDIDYRLVCRFDPQKDTIHCTEDVTFSPGGMPLNEIHLHFYPHHRWSQEEVQAYRRYAEYFAVEDPFGGEFDPNRAGVEEVQVNGKTVPFEFRGEDETVLVLKTRVLPAERIRIKIRFWAYIPRRVGRFGRMDGVYSLYRFYPILSVYENGKYLDYPDLKVHQPYISQWAHYDVKVTLPRAFVPAGSLPGRPEEEGDPGSVTWHFSGEGRLRDFYLAFSRKYRLYEDTYDGVKILVYYLGDRLEKAKRIAQIVRRGLEFFSREIGGYPYPQFSVIPIYLGYGGNETSCAMMLDRRVYDLPFVLQRYQEFLVVHELGHQWWYNQVGSDEYKQTWMDEGINSYWVSQYLRWRYGPDPEVLVLPRPLRWLVPNFTFSQSGIYKWRYLTLRGKRISAIGEIGRFKEPSLIFAIAYGKGERALEILARRFGRGRLKELMRRYFSTYRGKIAHLEDFKALLKQSLGEEAVRTLEFYLSDKAVNYTWRQEDGRLLLARQGPEPPGGVEVRVRTRSGGVIEKRVLNGEDFSLPVEDVDVAILDPDDEVLEVNEDDNTYPQWKAVEKKVSLLNHFLYSLPVVNPSATLRLGAYANHMGVGGRLSYVNPSTEFRMSAGVVHDPSGGERAYLFDISKPALFGKWLELGLNYVYDDIYESDILHRKLNLYLKLDLGLPPANPFKRGDNLRLYLGREWRQRGYEGVYYSEQDFAYLGLALEKGVGRSRWQLGIEKGGHFFSGETDFLRGWARVDYTRQAGPLEVGVRGYLGLSDEKDHPMFYLGGEEAMRSYRKESLEYANQAWMGLDLFYPLWGSSAEGHRTGWVDLEKVDLNAFFTLGSGWDSNYSDGEEYAEVGVGLRLHLSFLSNLGLGQVRLYLAHSLKEDHQDRFGIAFSQ